MVSLRSSHLIPLGVLVLAACSDATGTTRPGAVSLSFRTGPSAQTAAAPLAAAAPITIDAGGSSLVINRVQLVLGEIELKSATATDACGGDDSHRGSGSESGTRGNECPEVELDPVLVDLPLSGTATLDLGALVPAGTYRELEFKIEATNEDNGPEAAFIARHPEFRNVSVRVEGTFNGQPFTFTSALEAEIELEFGTPLVVTGDAPLNLTVAVDVATWFRNGAVVLDPTVPGNALQIAQNIGLSFGAFRDDDRDGVDDHGHR